uniref:Uncharacterized protein TCIL3000_11_10820 n=1 Tax=Trypanosoma congolense (strain IL3000) TaxID=1068625 RepID=G0V1T4_TRYCI|nr:unnamed protein product [Trypanosoma congolense IL3000]
MCVSEAVTAVTTAEGTPSLLVTDSHCHVKLAAFQPDELSPGVSTNSAFVCGVKRMVVCGTHPDLDWELIEKIAATPSCTAVGHSTLRMEAPRPCTAIPGFGIHPWFAPGADGGPNERVVDEKEQVVQGDGELPSDSQVRGDTAIAFSSPPCCQRAGATSEPVRPRSTEELLELLERALKRFPNAIVGEIGLDKLRGPPESVQIDLFLAQMKLAARYRRPVSVHCVRSFGSMLTALQQLPYEDTPPAIVLHGFTGSLDFVRSVMKIRKKELVDISANSRSKPKAQALPIFFGVGAATSLRVKGFVENIFPFLLDGGRALLETDAHHSLMAGGSGGTVAVHLPPGLPHEQLPTAPGEEERCKEGLVLGVAGSEQLMQLLYLVSGGDIERAKGVIERCEKTCASVFDVFS